MGEKALTGTQALFVVHYLDTLNATEAAARAGYRGRNATLRSIGSENLTKPNIAEAIQEAMDKRSQQTGITAERVLQELACLGYADIRKLFSKSGALILPQDMDDDIAASIQSIEVTTRSTINEDGEKDIQHVHKIKLADKKGSLELLGKHLRLFTDKIEHTGKNDGAIEIITKDMSPVEAARIYKAAMRNG